MINSNDSTEYYPMVLDDDVISLFWKKKYLWFILILSKNICFYFFI
jgi:hypothetical protein